MLSVRQLARQLGCSRETVRKAIVSGALKANKVHAKLWAIEADQRDLTLFKARLEYLKEVRCFRSLLMKTLWQIGKLRPRRQRKQVPIVVIERLKRPLMVTVGQGATARTVGIVWQGDEGQAACPCCASLLRIR
jgi:excisionase family DNA binding protein